MITLRTLSDILWMIYCERKITAPDSFLAQRLRIIEVEVEEEFNARVREEDKIKVKKH